MQNAFGVVESVDAEQPDVRFSQCIAEPIRPLSHVLPARDLGEASRIDGDREPRGPYLPERRKRPRPGRSSRLAGGPVRRGLLCGWYPHKRPAGNRACSPPARAAEVGRVTIALEPDQVRAEQACDDLSPPRQLREDLVTRERDVDEDPDAQVAALFAEHQGDKLELIVIYPNGRADGCLLGCSLGESPVDAYVGIPPWPAELRRGDHVVIQGPQGGVAESLVVVADLLSGQSDPDQVHAGDVERPGCVVR